MAASSRTCSGPNAPFECVHRDRLIAPTMREASPRLSPAAAAVMIHTAQDGKLSITDVPPLRTGRGHTQPRTVNKLLICYLACRASSLAQYRRARPAAAMTIRNATTGLNGTNAPMTVPTAPVQHYSLADPACVLTRGSYSPFFPCLTDEPSNRIGEEQDN